VVGSFVFVNTIGMVDWLFYFLLIFGSKVSTAGNLMATFLVVVLGASAGDCLGTPKADV
jgi:hypothetical protein